VKPININYAYDGFLYAPLVLAYNLGLFQGNMRLKYRNGDIPAIDSLAFKSEDANNWFAICDPFAKDISKVQASIGRDQIYIVGSLINRLPVWLYNSHADFDHVSNENDLLAHKHKLEYIKCYERYNTGYLIGDRLRKKFDFAETKLIGCKFGKEFEQPISTDTLIVTSDILYIAEELDSRNIVFNYPQNAPELNPFLFTAVLTLKSVVDEHLYAVLNVLSALRTAIDLLSVNRVDPAHIALLANKYNDFLEKRTCDDAKKLEIVNKSISILKEEAIYSINFDVQETMEAYNNAKSEWETLLAKPFPGIEECNNPIPSLLIKKNWEDDHTLIQFFTSKFRKRPVSELKNLSAGDIVCLILVLLSFVYGLYLFLKNPPSGSVDLLMNALFFALQSFLTVFLFRDLFWKYKRDQFHILFGLIEFCFGVELAIIHLFHLH